MLRIRMGNEETIKLRKKKLSHFCCSKKKKFSTNLNWSQQEDDEAEEVNNLCEEATMPIEDVIKKLNSGQLFNKSTTMKSWENV